MPYVWEKDISKVAVTVDELVPSWFPSYNALKVRMHRDKDFTYGIKRLQRSCIGTEVLINFDTLPREIQLALGDPRKVTHVMEHWYEQDGSARRFYSEFELGNGRELDTKYIDEYTINASVLNAVHIYKEKHIDEYSKKNKRAPKKLYEFMVKEAQVFNEVLHTKHRYTHTLPKSERQFRHVYDSYFTDQGKNYASLISGKLQNDNARIVTDKVSQLLDSLFAGTSTKPNKKKVHTKYQLFLEGLLEVINNDTGEMYNPAEYKPLSERSVTKWLSSWHSKIGTYSKRGADRQKTMELFSIPNEMKLPKYAGSLLSIDDRQPPFEYAPSERLWVYNGLDVASRMIVATVWGRSKEGMILEFYRQLVRNYTQWGVKLPYELEAEVSLNSSFKDTFLKNGVMFDKVRLIPNLARAKYIERVNKELRHDLEKEYDLWKGRPHARDESSQSMNYENIYKEEKYRSYESLVQQTLKVVSDWNNMPHPDKNELTKWEYFLQNQHPNLSETNWKLILPYIGYTTKTSCNRGRIRLQGENYYIGDKGNILFGSELLNKMELIEGEDVVMYWLDGNDGQVMKAVVYVNGIYVCEAMPVPKWQRAELERTDEDEINRQVQARYVATVEAFRKQRIHSIEEVTIIDNSSRTLNDAFVMPGYKPYKPQETSNEIIDNEDEDYIIPNTYTIKKISQLNNF